MAEGVGILTLEVQRVHHFGEDIFSCDKGETLQIFVSALALSVPAAGAARESCVMNGGVFTEGRKP